MIMRPERLAVYTTVYPAVERYLAAWYESLRAQTDAAFDLWIGVDAMEPTRVGEVMEVDRPVRWVVAEPGDSPAKIRGDALARIVEEYDAVVLVDSDDLLEPTRVAAAREALRCADVSGCALQIMDAGGHDVEAVFGPPPGADTSAMLPQWNVFGLSNTAWRTPVLRECLPLPADCALPDWLLATRAWIGGARLAFDPVPRMRYRQYDENVARVLVPFTARDVRLATDRVLQHYRCALADFDRMPAERRRELGAARERVRAFHRVITESDEALHRYVAALNALPPRYVWWWSVANPQLEDVWRA